MTTIRAVGTEPEPNKPERGHPAVEVEMLYRDQRQALMRFFARYRASPDDALDLTQETFLQLAKSEALHAGEIRHPIAYLRTIARNLLRNKAQTAMRHSEPAHVDIDDHPVVAASEVTRLEARDSLVRLEAAMRSMKPKTREIFMAHRLDGMSYAAIASQIGMSVSGVEKQMSRALAHIDRLLDLD